MQIVGIYGRAIFDSRGNETVECDVVLDNGVLGRASVPSGASTGTGEALELRDADGGVTGAASNINNTIAPVIVDMDPTDQRAIDQALIDLDGTENKSRLGANAILAVSAAVIKATARALNQPLWRHIADTAGTTPSLPLPLVNVINGGRHANFTTDIQEYMIVPLGARTIGERLAMTSKVFHTLGEVLKSEGYPTTVGDEGGYAPQFRNGNVEPLFLIGKAVQAAGYNFGSDITVALDVAASEFYSDGWYNLAADKRKLSNGEMVGWFDDLAHQFPIVSVEDGLNEDDWDGWADMTGRLGDKLQLVGDDLLVTNTKLIQRAIDERSCNAVLIKPNQIGTISETIDAVLLAKSARMNTIVSHRSGETEDTLISHLAVGLDAGQIKTGSMSRGERIAKYNELLRIAEQL
jgi:enolase